MYEIYHYEGLARNMICSHTVFSINSSDTHIHCSQESIDSFFVFSRQLRHEKEMFVCFHESIPQSAIEMAFRVGFGT